MRRWIVSGLIAVMVLVTVIGSVIAAANKKDSPPEMPSDSITTHV